MLSNNFKGVLKMNIYELLQEHKAEIECVDICEDAEERTAWIYNVQYGVKMLMWGEMASNDRDTFCGLVFKNIPEYADMYAEEYED